MWDKILFRYGLDIMSNEEMENAAEKACALNFIANNGTFILISLI